MICEGVAITGIIGGILGFVFWLMAMETRVGQCQHSWVDSPRKTEKLGKNIEVRTTPKRCAKCGKKELMVGVWLVVEHEGVIYESLIPTGFMGRKPA